MRTITPQTQTAWEATFKGGESQRAYVRATIQSLSSATFPYDNTNAGSSTVRRNTGKFYSLVFNNPNRPVELPNIASMSWSRTVDENVATASLELYNSEILPIGVAPDPSDLGFERPGYFTYNRGVSAEAQSRWGQTTNGWRDLIVPDAIVRTYEGYGVDTNSIPEDDVHMYPSGVWLIDDISYVGGRIQIKMRDIGRELVEQIVFPPVVTGSEYPLSWEPTHQVADPPTYTTTGTWVRPRYSTDSNIPYIGRGFSDGDSQYVSNSGAVRGHHGSHAFDGKSNTYWLSVGNNKGWSSAYEYVQGTISSGSVSAVKVNVVGGPYRIYVSVGTSGSWYGSSKIPYKARAVDTNADIRFVKSVKVKRNGSITIALPKTYTGVTRVRITLSELSDFGVGRYRYRGAISEVLVSSAVQKQNPTTYHQEGDFNDYTEIVKWVCAWGGFYWPCETSNKAYIVDEGGTKNYFNGSPASDPVIGKGRVWGDFETTGTKAMVRIDAETWDKKPLMDVINYVRDIIGYVFYVDETGAAVWRRQNIWSIGNWKRDILAGSVTRETQVIEIDENEQMLGLDVNLSSRALRNYVFVGEVSGKYGATAPGFEFRTALTKDRISGRGLRRVGGWTDQRFGSEEECQVMADLISIRQMFTARTANVVIPGNPAIQIDDQIRLFERQTAETYYHYVRSISSTYTASTGEWTYALQTNWLGETPFTAWAFSPWGLSKATQDFLKAVGII